MLPTKSTVLVLVMALLVLVVVPLQTNAAPMLQVSSGKLTGATGVDVGGALYDVAFLDGTCASLFDGCDSLSDFAFSTLASGLAATQALFDQVLIDGALGAFDSQPGLTFGCGNALQCSVYTPFAIPSVGGVHLATAFNHSTVDAAPFFSSTSATLFTTVNANMSLDMAVFARWTPQSTTVPEPATVALLGVGLCGLARRARRSRRPGSH